MTRLGGSRRSPSPLGRLVAAVGRNPVRVAGGVGAAVAAVVSWQRLTDGLAAAAGVPPVGALVDFAVAHPAYPAAVVVGLVALLFADG